MNEHEVLDDTVEGGALVSESELLAIRVLASSKSTEVLSGLGYGLMRMVRINCEQFKRT